jgi:hypothetical protein
VSRATRSNDAIVKRDGPIAIPVFLTRAINFTVLTQVRQPLDDDCGVVFANTVNKSEYPTTVECR